MPYAFIGNFIVLFILAVGLLLGWLPLTLFYALLLGIILFAAFLSLGSFQALTEHVLWLKKQIYKKQSATEVLVPPKGLKSFLYALEHHTYQDSKALFKVYTANPYAVTSLFTALSSITLLSGCFGYFFLENTDFFESILGRGVLLSFLYNFFMAPSPIVHLVFGFLGAFSLYGLAITLRIKLKNNLPYFKNILPTEVAATVTEEGIIKQKSYKTILTVYGLCFGIFILFVGYSYYTKLEDARVARYKATSLEQTEKRNQLKKANKRIDFLTTENAALNQQVNDLNKKLTLKEESLQKTLTETQTATDLAAKATIALTEEKQTLAQKVNVLKVELSTLKEAFLEKEQSVKSLKVELEKTVTINQGLSQGEEETAQSLQKMANALATLQAEHDTTVKTLAHLQDALQPLPLQKFMGDANLALFTGHSISGHILRIPLDVFFSEIQDEIKTETKAYEHLLSFIETALKEDATYQAVITLHSDSLPPQSYTTAEELTSVQAARLFSALNLPEALRNRVHIIGLGTKQQLNTKLTEDALKENRRLELSFSKAALCLKKNCF